jgi:hypothetical protein
MRNNPVEQRKVVPFTGELYPIVPTQPQPQPSNDFAVITAVYQKASYPILG